MKITSVPSPPLLRVLPGCLCQLSKGQGDFSQGPNSHHFASQTFRWAPAWRCRPEKPTDLGGAVQIQLRALSALGWEPHPGFCPPIVCPSRPVLSLSSASPACDWWVCRGSWDTRRMQQCPEERQKGKMKLLLLSRKASQETKEAIPLGEEIGKS